MCDTIRINRILWLSDLHFDFLVRVEIEVFLASLPITSASALLITGDISNAEMLGDHLTLLAQSTQLPIYFVLGNHDFYGSNFAWLDGQVADLGRQFPQLVHLQGQSPIPLTPQTCLIGHRGWADGRAGAGGNTLLRLNDHDLIADLSSLDSRTLFAKLAQLGIDSVNALRDPIQQAVAAFDRILIATHVPPFVEASLYNNRPSEHAYSPHFVNFALGEYLLSIADANSAKTFQVYCGHSHHQARFQARPNLVVHVAHAKYREPGFSVIEAF